MTHPTGRHVQSQSIRAAVLRARGGPLAIETLEMDGPRDDEVLVRLVASGVCHTDMDLCDYWDGAAHPVVLGHEGAGVVVSVGKDVEGIDPGDHVVLSYQSCGRCRQCRAGHPAGCERFYEANFGFARLDGSNALRRSGVGGHFFGQSSFSTHTLATKRNLVKIPEDLDLAMLAPLGCGLQTGAGTVMNSLGVRGGASIAVFGTGSVGLAAIMAARVVGAATVVGVDIIAERLELALELGATHVIDNRRHDVASRITAIAPVGVDFVVETTGDPELSHIAVGLLRPKGTLALLAGAGGQISLPGGRKAISVIQGDAVPQRFIPELIALHQTGRFPFDRIVKFYEFKDINKAMADSRKGRTIKPVLRISQA